MATKPRTLSQQINRASGGNRNFNGANDTSSRRFVTRRTNSGETLSGRKLQEGSQQFGTRAQRSYDLRSAFASPRFADGTPGSGAALTVG